MYLLHHTFNLEHTRIDKGSMKHDLALFKDEISMSTNLVIIGQPPGKVLFNVKSRTLRVLTLAFLRVTICISFACILLGDKTKQQGP